MLYLINQRSLAARCCVRANWGHSCRGENHDGGQLGRAHSSAVEKDGVRFLFEAREGSGRSIDLDLIPSSAGYVFFDNLSEFHFLYLKNGHASTDFREVGCLNIPIQEGD